MSACLSIRSRGRSTVKRILLVMSVGVGVSFANPMDSGAATLEVRSILPVCVASPQASAPTAGHAARRRSSGNAATIYRQAFELLDPERRLPVGMTAEDMDELLQLTETGRIAPNDIERVRELMTKARPFLSAVEPAGAMQQSDFGLDHAQGFHLMLPHLQSMRTTARLLRASSALAIHDSDWDATLSALRSYAALGGHAGQDRVLISSLVGAATSSASLPSLDAVIDTGTLTQDQAKALSEALRFYRGSDPFDFGGSVRSEFGMLSASIAGKNQAELSELVSIVGGSGKDQAALFGLSDRELARHLERARGTYERAAQAFESNDPEAARRIVAELESEAERNPLLALMMPNFSRALESKILVGEAIAERLAKIDAIADGSKKAIELANASTWLRRAAAIGASVPDETQEAVEIVLFAGRDADPVFLERAERLFVGAGGTIRDALERALACGSLDLDVPNDGDYGLSMKWLPGLRAACRILLAEGRIGDADVAADRARLVAGVSAVLIRDPSFMRSLTARSIAEESRELFARVADAAATGATPGAPAATDTAPGAPTTEGAGVRSGPPRGASPTGDAATAGDDRSIEVAAMSAEDSRAALAKYLRELSVSEAFRITRGIEADRDRLATGSPWGRVIDPVRRKVLTKRGPEFALFLQVAAPREEAWMPAHTPPATANADAKVNADAKDEPHVGALNRFDDLLPKEAVVEARKSHLALREARFFAATLTLVEDDPQSLNPFKGITPVVIRTYGTDLNAAAATASKLSELADRLQR